MSLGCPVIASKAASIPEACQDTALYIDIDLETALEKLPEQREILAKARGFLHAAEEAFGIAMAEAQSTGVPVIAYSVGGAQDIVLSGETGLFFEHQEVHSLQQALSDFEKMEFDPQKIRDHAKQFSKEVFVSKMRALVEEKLISTDRYLCGDQFPQLKPTK